MKTAVDRIGKGKQRDINARFKAMASHYVFRLIFAIALQGGRKDKLKRMFKIPVVVFGRSFPSLRI